jgi:acetyltransferase-like isoleucine patch superfamily enzyme
MNLFIVSRVFIGKNIVIAAFSVVEKYISEDEIWAGNPVKLIKKMNFNE